MKLHEELSGLVRLRVDRTHAADSVAEKPAKVVNGRGTVLPATPVNGWRWMPWEVSA